MAQVKTFEELQIGDIFITNWIDGTIIKLTVQEKTQYRLVIPEKLGGIDISLEEFFVIGNKIK